MIVYKYLPPSRIDVLEYSRIRFTQPALFNDPFETFPCFLEYGPWLLQTIHQQASDKFGEKAAQQTLRQRQTLATQKLLDLPKILSKYFVILSLSKTRDNLLMWSHYAESHRGFVIGFDSSNQFLAPGNGKTKDGLKSVHYSNKRYIVPKSGFQSLDVPNLREANDRVFFTKGTYWKYEREVRILAHPNSADTVLPGSDGQDIYLFSFPTESVKEIIFGFQISKPHQRQIFELVRSKYPRATIGKAFPHQSEFSVYVKMFKLIL